MSYFLDAQEMGVFLSECSKQLLIFGLYDLLPSRSHKKQVGPSWWELFEYHSWKCLEYIIEDILIIGNGAW